MSENDFSKLDDLFASAKASEPYFPAENFTMAVMAQLPEAEGLSDKTKNLVVLLGTAIGSGLACTVMPIGELARSFDMLSFDLSAVAVVGGAMMLAACGITFLAQTDRI